MEEVKAHIIYQPGIIESGARSCALCMRDKDNVIDCDTCPLALNGYKCIENHGSPYNLVMRAETKKEVLLASENMVKVLKEVLAIELKK